MSSQIQAPLKKALFFAASLLPFFTGFSAPPARLNLEKLSSEDIATVDSFLKKKASWIKKKEAEGTLPLLNFKDLRRGLSQKEKRLLSEIMGLKPKSLDVKTPFLGLSPEKLDLVKIEDQTVRIHGKPVALAPQYLPHEASRSCGKMMRKMKEDLGRRLYVESGFRSSAYQLYSFVLYLREHGYSLRETAKLNALPGYSEHGNPKRQAVDFINEEGINGEANPDAFVKLPEYQWLLAHAASYGFVLSYPQGNLFGISFEPWHWKFEGGRVLEKNAISSVRDEPSRPRSE